MKEDGSRDLTEDFIKAVEGLLDELKDTVSAIFMYKEENTYTVTKRIYEVNALTRRLIRLRTELERSFAEQEEIDRHNREKGEFKHVNCE